MSVSSSSLAYPSFRTTGLSGLVLLSLTFVACSSSAPQSAVFAPTDLDSIEMASTASLFAPIRMDEIEITAESIEQQEPGIEADGLAWFKPAPREVAASREVAEVEVVEVAEVVAPREVAEQWLRNMENAPKTTPSKLAQAALPATMGALGAGVGVNGTVFQAEFKPVRKSFASRPGPSSTTVASIADIGRTTTKAMATATKRMPVQREKEALEAGDIKRIVKKQQARVRACYERALKTETHLSGKLMMAWSVRPDGSVSDVSVADDQLGSEKVSRCVAHAVSQFRFPQGPDLVQVEYPMVFEPGNRF